VLLRLNFFYRIGSTKKNQICLVAIVRDRVIRITFRSGSQICKRVLNIFVVVASVDHTEEKNCLGVISEQIDVKRVGQLSWNQTQTNTHTRKHTKRYIQMASDVTLFYRFARVCKAVDINLTKNSILDVRINAVGGLTRVARNQKTKHLFLLHIVFPMSSIEFFQYFLT